MKKLIFSLIFLMFFISFSSALYGTSIDQFDDGSINFNLWNTRNTTSNPNANDESFVNESDGNVWIRGDGGKPAELIGNGSSAINLNSFSTIWTEFYQTNLGSGTMQLRIIDESGTAVVLKNFGADVNPHTYRLEIFPDDRIVSLWEDDLAGAGTETNVSISTLATDDFWSISYYSTGAGASGTGGRAYWINYTTENKIIANMTMPSNAESLTDENISFNTTLTPYPDNLNLTNATLYVWFGNGSLLNNTEVNIVTGNSRNFTNWTILDFELGSYIWNVYACGINGTETYCQFSEPNQTFNRGFLVDAFGFENPVLELSSQVFSVNLTLSDNLVVSYGSLDYNGTEYGNAIKTNVAGNNWTITKTLIIPVGVQGFSSEPRNFSWTFTITDLNTGTSTNTTTDNQTQTVNELTFSFCNAQGNTIPVLNFTLNDEKTSSVIDASSNATTFEASFQYGADPGNLVKNYSMSNISLATPYFAFCIGNENNTIYADMEAEFTAVDFIDNSYHLTNATLTNLTNNIDLFLLRDADAVQFFLTVNEDLVPLPSAIVSVSKFFIGEGVYKTVGIYETDASGKFTAWLELDKKYRFTVIKNGELRGIVDRTASCEQAPCQLTVDITSGSGNIYDDMISAFAGNVLYNLSYNPLTKIVTFDFVDITGTATSFRMMVFSSEFNQTDIIVFDKRVFTSSGSMTFNATNLSDGSYRVEVFVSRSPDLLIDYLIFVVSELVGRLGLTGLFVSFLLILTIIFGISLSPSLLVMAVPLSLTIVTLMGVASIGGLTLTAIYILAIIAVILMRK